MSASFKPGFARRAAIPLIPPGLPAIPIAPRPGVDIAGDPFGFRPGRSLRDVRMSAETVASIPFVALFPFKFAWDCDLEARAAILAWRDGGIRVAAADEPFNIGFGRPRVDADRCVVVRPSMAGDRNE